MTLRFGVFLPPYHNPRRDPTSALDQDLRHVEELDRLGYAQVWFGEHHSGGFEYIASPELMIAAAAQRTARIELCSGVISLPYHHPLMVADRIVLLDHLTRGRVRIGFGPGALVADAQMMGLDYNLARPRMEEALDAILELLDSPDAVHRKTDWFTLDDARLQLQSYTQPRVRLAVAAAMSPNGPKLAGRYGLGLLSVGGTSAKAAELLEQTWDITTVEARKTGQTVDRADWTIVGNVHLAETEEQAIEDTRYGLREFLDYRHVTSPMKMIAPGEEVSHEELVHRVNESGFGCIGGPERVTEYIQSIVDRTGGFGTFLLTAHDWADPAATSHMYELVASDVMPRFTGATAALHRSYAWTKERKEGFNERFDTGIRKATESYRR
ncbi:LLM class flavin-dependent oxidoreductase [Amycolatopsis acidicola]|uniref:LLM class flavin-dependent oxidoreductase n=1 Tax=Amycolatopsis acidicola TaxID=2596893 RepID=A0A5N0UVZ8_9PSEU|nr:LLM class flavin-dependent oxidoreductase [Amycolatopsis acidicola]KAA9156755.1 LLM class flavin-dependent oxidoreductase [Amycolatopsis acidicola]